MNKIIECRIPFKVAQSGLDSYQVYNLSNHTEIRINEIGFLILKYLTEKKCATIEEIDNYLKKVYNLNEEFEQYIASFIDELCELEFLKKGENNMISTFIEEDNRTYDFDKHTIKVNNNLKKIIIKGQNGLIKIRTNNSDNEISISVKYMKMYTDAVLEPKYTDNEFYFEVNKGKLSDAQIEITVPDYNYEDVIIENVNSPVNVENIKSINMILSTKNGMIDLDDLTINKLDVETSNGLINCSIKDCLSQDNDISLVTSNGSINLNMPRDNECGYKITVYNPSSNSNRLKTNMLLQNEESEGEKQNYISKGYDSYSTKCRLRFITSNGYISIN